MNTSQVQTEIIICNQLNLKRHRHEACLRINAVFNKGI